MYIDYIETEDLEDFVQKDKDYVYAQGERMYKFMRRIELIETESLFNRVSKIKVNVETIKRFSTEPEEKNKGDFQTNFKYESNTLDELKVKFKRIPKTVI